MGNTNPLPISGEIRPLVPYSSLLHDDTLGAAEVDKVNSIIHDRLQAGQMEANLMLAAELQGAPDGILTRSQDTFVKDMASTLPEDVAELRSRANAAERLYRDEELPAVRLMLGTLPIKHQKKVEKHLEASLPEFFGNLKHHGGAKGQNWITWLSETASNEQLTNFLQWHVHTLAQQRRSPLIVAKIKQSTEEFRAAVTRGESEGFLGRVAIWLQEWQQRVQDVYIGNIFEDVFLDGADAYSRKIYGDVMIKQGEGKDRKSRTLTIVKRIDDTLWHEYGHIIFNFFGEEWWYEAGIEHMRLMLQDGQLGAISPKARGEVIMKLNDKEPPAGSNYYQVDREIMACLGVDPYLLARAFTGTHEDKQVFIRSVDQVWGVKDVMKKVGNKLAEYEAETINKALPKKFYDWRAHRMALHRVVEELVNSPELILGPLEHEPDLKAA